MFRYMYQKLKGIKLALLFATLICVSVSVCERVTDPLCVVDPGPA